jgi:hypothetical protein
MSIDTNNVMLNMVNLFVFSIVAKLKEVDASADTELHVYYDPTKYKIKKYGWYGYCEANGVKYGNSIDVDIDDINPNEALCFIDAVKSLFNRTLQSDVTSSEAHIHAELCRRHLGMHDSLSPYKIMDN